jgi:phosphoribosylamine--glycine ligase
MAVGGWFGPAGWSKWFYENWEYKKLMADDMCIATGEMGTLSRMVRKSKLAEQVLIPLGPQLEKLGYVGFIDTACIIDADGPWPMELTMRDGWPTRHNVTAHAKNADPVQWLLDLLNGKDTIECVDGEVCISIVVALPDFPYSKITNRELCGIPVRGWENEQQVHLSEVMIGEAPVMVGDKSVRIPTPVTCGDYLAVVTGTGATISAARASAYAAAKKMRKTPGSPFYRPDIGAGRMKKDLPMLHKWGYAKGLEF